MATLGLVTILYKSDEVLEDFFDSLFKQKYKDFHIYIVDNSPSLTSEILLEKLLIKYSIKNITYIKNSKNVGVAKGNNQGIKRALEDGCKYILLLNNDICFSDSDVFDEIILNAYLNPNSIIVPKIYYFSSNKIWYGGGKFFFYRASVRHFVNNELEKNQGPQEVFYAPTCFALIPVSIFEKVGLMDENYFVYVDDADFMYRCITNNIKIMYINTIHIYHKISISTGGMFSDFGLFYDTRNRVYWVRKSFPFKYKYFALIYIFFQMTYHSLRQKRRGCFSIFIKAYFAGFKMKLPNNLNLLL
jgi:GT2 family glycosyltransferase